MTLYLLPSTADSTYSGRLVLRSSSCLVLFSNLHLRAIHNFTTCNCPGGIQLHKNEGSSSPSSLMPLDAEYHTSPYLYCTMPCLPCLQLLLVLVPHKALFPSSQLPESTPSPAAVNPPRGALFAVAYYFCAGFAGDPGKIPFKS